MEGGALCLGEEGQFAGLGDFVGAPEAGLGGDLLERRLHYISGFASWEECKYLVAGKKRLFELSQLWLDGSVQQRIFPLRITIVSSVIPAASLSAAKNATPVR